MWQLFGWTIPRALVFHRDRSAVLGQAFPRDCVSQNGETLVSAYYLGIHLVPVACSALECCNLDECWANQCEPEGLDGYVAVRALERVNESLCPVYFCVGKILRPVSEHWAAARYQDGAAGEVPSSSVSGEALHLRLGCLVDKIGSMGRVRRAHQPR